MKAENISNDCRYPANDEARSAMLALRPSLSALALLLLGLTAAETLAQGAGRRQVLEGNRHYAEGKYDEANNSYRDAQIDNPESPIIHFNIGDVQYQKRNYEEALKTFQQTIQKSNDAALQAQAYYNLGNTLYRLNRLPESIMAYQQALKLAPHDEDAKYNLEYVRAKLKQEAQKQPQDQQQQQNQQQPGEQNQNQQEQNQNEQQQDRQQKQDGQQQDQEQQEQAQQQEQQQGQEMKQGKLSQEDAERLLEALENQEKEAQKKRQAKVSGRVRVEKDW